MPRKRVAAIVVVAAAALFLAGGAVGSLSSGRGMWAWFNGDSEAYIGRMDGSSDLTLFAKQDLNMSGTHVRIGGQDGNFEFEHGDGIPTSHLSAYFIGSATRTPISIGGGDDQDVLSLIVGGNLGQKHDLQEWVTSGTVKTAVDGRGRLRLGEVTLTTRIEKGHALLVAILPNGKSQVLARARG